MFIGNVTELSDKVWNYVIKNSMKYQFWGLLESHVHDKLELQEWDAKARKAKFILYANPAREHGKVVAVDKQRRSNEGGEMFLG